MLVTFRTEAYADILMFGDIAVQLLKLMGQSGAVPGVMAEDVPAALERLRTAVAVHQATVPKVAEDVEDDAADESPVDLAQRAFPLIELLEAAAAEPWCVGAGSGERGAGSGERGAGSLTSVGFFMSHLRALVMIRCQGTRAGRARVPGNRGR